jgi:hypothetical protein
MWIKRSTYEALLIENAAAHERATQLALRVDFFANIYERAVKERDVLLEDFRRAVGLVPRATAPVGAGAVEGVVGTAGTNRQVQVATTPRAWQRQKQDEFDALAKKAELEAIQQAIAESESILAAQPTAG